MIYRICFWFFSVFGLVLPSHALFLYQVDTLNDTITINGSATGTPLSLGLVHFIVWTENVPSSDNAGLSPMVYQSGAVMFSDGVSAYDISLALNSNGSIASIEFSIEPDSNSTFDLTFDDYTWSYAGASVAQKSAFENEIFGADLPIVNTLGSFGDLEAIPEASTLSALAGVFIIGLLGMRRLL